MNQIKKRLSLLGILLLASLIFSNLIYADFGVGISPTRIVIEIQAGEPHQLSLLVFNSGDEQMNISVTASGEIEEFTKIEPGYGLIEPEPKPHAMPIKNGQNFIVTFDPASNRDIKTYTGSISAIGTPLAGSQLGGSVGVATQVEIRVLPPKSIFAFVKPLHIIILVIVALIVILFFTLWKMGLKISFQKKGELSLFNIQSSNPPL